MASTTRAPQDRMAPVDRAAGLRTNGSNDNGIEREHVTDIQRARILAAMAEVACARGAMNVTVAHVVERAGVSRRTFYELFDDRDDCFLTALEDALTRLAAHVVPAYEQPGLWRKRIRDALIALLWFFESEPHIGRLLIVETLAAGPRALRRRSELLAHLIAVVNEGSQEPHGMAKPSGVVAEGTVGAVLSVLHGRLCETQGPVYGDRPGALVDLTGPLMGMIVLPYLGSAAARRELERPNPRAMRGSAHASANPLKQVGMRLTYRTARVLMAVSESPGASNRTVGTCAGIADQGQISKLLSRLEKLGLVVNEGLAPGRGAPNAWTLTEQGEEVCCALTGCG